VDLIYEQNRRQAMNKAELANEVSAKTGLTKKETQNVIDVLTETIGDTLAKGEKVTLVGFGTFQVASRKARRGVNPQTRESIQIPAKKVPKFVAGKGLREKIK
jgi:DNA-binding protein HU-beta